MPLDDRSESFQDRSDVPNLSLADGGVAHPDVQKQSMYAGNTRGQNSDQERTKQAWIHQRAVKGNARMRQLYGTEPQRRGGTTTKQRYGHEHYVEIGTKGGETVRDKRGKDFYVEIGRRGGKRPKHRSDASQVNADAIEVEYESSLTPPPV
jgi:general stress protein YciG